MIKLTRKQEKVLEYMQNNPADTNKEIAEALHNSPYTIKDHVKGLCNRFGVETKRELIKKIKSSG